MKNKTQSKKSQDINVDSKKICGAGGGHNADSIAKQDSELWSLKSGEWVPTHRFISDFDSKEPKLERINGEEALHILTFFKPKNRTLRKSKISEFSRAMQRDDILKELMDREMFGKDEYVILADGFEDAFLGVTAVKPARAVYSYWKCLDIIMKQLHGLLLKLLGLRREQVVLPLWTIRMLLKISS